MHNILYISHYTIYNADLYIHTILHITVMYYVYYIYHNNVLYIEYYIPPTCNSL